MADSVSDKAWNYSQADYSIDEWRAACLIDMGTGDPATKGRYKVPVREPDGTLNRNGMENTMLPKNSARLLDHANPIAEDVLPLSYSIQNLVLQNLSGEQELLQKSFLQMVPHSTIPT